MSVQRGAQRGRKTAVAESRGAKCRAAIEISQKQESKERKQTIHPVDPPAVPAPASADVEKIPPIDRRATKMRRQDIRVRAPAPATLAVQGTLVTSPAAENDVRIHPNCAHHPSYRSLVHRIQCR